MGSRITSEYAEGGSAVRVGKGVTVGRSPHKTRVPDRQGQSPHANLPEVKRSPRVTGSAEARLTEEPGAGKPYAGSCAGGVG